LDAAVHRALAGESTPQQALEAAAGAWRKITEELGIDAQRRAYQRGLGQTP
jgi:multiple sugar transport system substrate-binding protein